MRTLKKTLYIAFPAWSYADLGTIPPGGGGPRGAKRPPLPAGPPLGLPPGISKSGLLFRRMSFLCGGGTGLLPPGSGIGFGPPIPGFHLGFIPRWLTLVKLLLSLSAGLLDPECRSS